MILTESCNPEHVVRLGPARLASCARTRGIRMTVAKSEQVVACARDTLTPRTRQRDLVEQLLTADLAMFIAVEAEIQRCERELTALIASAPARVLTSIPGVGVVRASAYGAVIGDHARFRIADAAYAFAGLSPASYESAGRARPGLGITKSESVTLRQVILELGKGMGMHHPTFADCRAAHRPRETLPDRRCRIPSSPRRVRVDARQHRVRPGTPDPYECGPARHDVTTDAETT